MLEPLRLFLGKYTRAQVITGVSLVVTNICTYAAGAGWIGAGTTATIVGGIPAAVGLIYTLLSVTEAKQMQAAMAADPQTLINHAVVQQPEQVIQTVVGAQPEAVINEVAELPQVRAVVTDQTTAAQTPSSSVVTVEQARAQL